MSMAYRSRPNQRASSHTRLSFWAWSLLVFALMLVASLLAVRGSAINMPARTLFIATAVAGLLTGFLYLHNTVRRTKPLLLAVVLVVALCGAWIATAGKAPDTNALRRAYVRQLGAFQGVRYAWGGETSCGIDCSGLMRVPLWQAMLKQGIRERNPRLLGPRLWKFWWRDLGARDMLHCTCDYTRVIGHAPKLAGCDTSALEPGDLAVADSGVHVMAYYGQGRWIEASPDDKKVVMNAASSDSKRGWFNVPVTFLRWRALDN